ncbi:MAG TPA: translation initiation factor IF-2 [Candidatus Peribacter riflensis]|uniref:Translation initiation factor IF-2 n=1 Tax=Candidatus Peribacter riflensis TaxID=1735162 RepID=A0A0S1SIC9_9BACT|nr:MAG: Translation initiation factor 2 [Candidatus Peribacter riflensis]OGJ77093.1 MAG: translation initiation factor IF-2 [Candidatus Peribacteria bacterium RIFOXYB1_FULL_57_12]ALM11042.1 MAG: Translation initiation factor 2 [Candidatus Peribacter riflensis]ALM12145.1 MAG: Translation initiation factor 2 [Candidatus Peribacter riflensis]ALM13248.1 MAG: Translation initiation factor 2 [Candidatus Peribacter riflensis]
MRLVQVAKALGMTGQQLRHELTQVNFGVKPTDREVTDSLAQGIIRFLARKYGKEVDMEALQGMSLDEDKAPKPPEAQGAPATPSAEPAAEADGSGANKSVNVLRKLTLEDVSREAIARQEQAMSKSRPSGQRRRFGDRKARGVREKRDISSTNQEQIKKKKEGVVSLPAQITVKELAEKTGIQIPMLIQTLMKNGVLATITQAIDYDTAAVVATELGVTVAKQQEEASAEDLFSRNLTELLKDEPENLVKRPPVVVVMGHVDHGKTSILDVIRETNVAGGEAGGITQHIGAYQVEHKPAGSAEVHKITFLDTPGHEAFTAMRARGAQVTDIAVIVVAADEGVKPTTIEAIDHAKEAGVPMLVALNKMDKEGADVNRVMGEMAAQGIQSEEWGGQVPFVQCSAKTKQGITDLLDSIVLLSEMHSFTANPKRSAVATVIESKLDPSLGPLATIIINAGTLHHGESFVCGRTLGKVRTMSDAHGKRFEEVGPSGAVQVAGFHSVPEVGDILQVVASEKLARDLLSAVEERRNLRQTQRFVDLVSRLSEGKLSQLKIVLKADAQGSLEALKEALAKLTTETVTVKIIHASIGAVTDSDVSMAAASEGIVVAFHVPVPSGARSIAEREGVSVREYEVIYALLEDMEGLLKGLVEPADVEKIVGHLQVLKVFLTKKSEQIIGGRVTDGTMKRLPFRIQRGTEQVGTGRITSLRKGDADAKEVKEGAECGMRVEATTLIAEGDQLEVFLKELKRKEASATA